jgi:hypothetical protein
LTYFIKFDILVTEGIMSNIKLVTDFKLEIINSEETMIAHALKFVEIILDDPETDISETKEFQDFLLHLSLLPVRVIREVAPIIVDYGWVATAMLKHPTFHQRLNQCYETLIKSEYTPDYELHVAPSKTRTDFEASRSKI